MNNKWQNVIVPVKVIMVNGVICYRADEAARHLAMRMWSNVRNQYSSNWKVDTVGMREQRAITRTKRRLKNYFNGVFNS